MDTKALTPKMKSGDTLCSIRFWSFPRILYSLGENKSTWKLIIYICIKNLYHEFCKFSDTIISSQSQYWHNSDPSSLVTEAYCLGLCSSIMLLAMFAMSSSQPVMISWSSFTDELHMWFCVRNVAGVRKEIIHYFFFF